MIERSLSVPGRCGEGSEKAVGMPRARAGHGWELRGPQVAGLGKPNGDPLDQLWRLPDQSCDLRSRGPASLEHLRWGCCGHQLPPSDTQTLSVQRRQDQGPRSPPAWPRQARPASERVAATSGLTPARARRAPGQRTPASGPSPATPPAPRGPSSCHLQGGRAPPLAFLSQRPRPGPRRQSPGPHGGPFSSAPLPTFLRLSLVQAPGVHTRHTPPPGLRGGQGASLP